MCFIVACYFFTHILRHRDRERESEPHKYSHTGLSTLDILKLNTVHVLQRVFFYFFTEDNFNFDCFKCIQTQRNCYIQTNLSFVVFGMIFFLLKPIKNQNSMLLLFHLKVSVKFRIQYHNSIHVLSMNVLLMCFIYAY